MCAVPELAELIGRYVDRLRRLPAAPCGHREHACSASSLVKVAVRFTSQLQSREARRFNSSINRLAASYILSSGFSDSSY